MKITFPWFGNGDSVGLEHVRHMRRMHGVTGALHNIPAGDVWPMEDILLLKESIESAGLSFDAVESLPVHEDIKLRKGDYGQLIENYKENIVRLSRAGVGCICYNFTPAFNVTQPIIARELAEGPKPEIEDEPAIFAKTGEIDIQPSDTCVLSQDDERLIDDYRALGDKGLWRNFELFINEIMPVASKNDVNMAIHPDEQPALMPGIADMPGVAATKADIDRLLAVNSDRHNGIVMCSGIFSTPNGEVRPSFEDYARATAKYASMGRIHFAHVRDVKISEDGSISENAHISPHDSQDVERVLTSFFNAGYKGCFRYDHRRMTVAVDGAPNYGLYDRVVGAMYLTGIMIALESRLKLASGGDFS
ncbi:MAG: mannonate dehydratase [Synergistaceae bacterium]|jgi:mannonate dehydratase|nr:mannonate dehydratase [Synergistaceae bacterium]